MKRKRPLGTRASSSASFTSARSSENRRRSESRFSRSAVTGMLRTKYAGYGVRWEESRSMSGLSTRRPTEERAAQAAKKAAAHRDEGEKKLVANVPAHIHKAVRKRCIDQGVRVQDYILELLRKDGIS